VLDEGGERINFSTIKEIMGPRANNNGQQCHSTLRAWVVYRHCKHKVEGELSV
jgi:hypothetical protein